MTTTDNEPDQPLPHTWSKTVADIGCGLIAALFLLAVLTICVWGSLQLARGHR